MTGTAVSWGLGAALTIVASVAVWRFTRPPGRHSAVHQRSNSVLHLLMALGMAVMLLPRGDLVTAVLMAGFGAAAILLAVQGRLHHAMMAGTMVLMMHAEPVAMQMEMSASASGPSFLLIAAFGYAAVSACVFAWRTPVFAGYGKAAGRPACTADPLGRGCEVMMLISTAVMLLPMI